MALDLILKDMKDPWVRENFSRLQKYLSVQALLLADFQFFEVDIPAASGKYTLPHGMAFIPFDVLILSLTGNQSVYFHYQEFDKTNIYLTAAGPVRVRFLAGRFSQPGYEKGAVEYPLVAPATTNAVTTIAAGGTGQTTQAAAITALAGTQTNGRYLRSDGTATTLAAIQAADVPTLNQNTTGTAANITATSNSTLMTLSSLSLPGSQVTGDIAGNASNTTATTNTTLTTLSSLSLPVSQLSGAVAIGSGGTGQTTQTTGFDALSPLTTAGDMLTYASGHNARVGTVIGDIGKVWTSGGGSVSNNWSLVDLTASVKNALPIANGGTNNGSLAVTAGGVLYTDGSKLVNVGAGTAGQALKSNGASAPTWGTVASTGSVNFISNPDAETDTAGYATYSNTAQALPVTGTGGSPTVTWTRTTSTPLTGTGSFLFTKDAANRQGQGASYDFVVDNASVAKVMSIDFDYEVASGTFVAGASGVDSDIEIYIYDVTNGVVIQPSGPSTYKLFSNSSTIPTHFTTTFQTASNSTSYRLIFHVATTSASAYTVKFDSISVAPAKYVYGSPITDTTSFTPTGAWTTNTAYAGTWKREGDSMVLNYQVSLSGAPDATNLSLNLPSGYSIDTSKLPGGTSTTQALPNSVVAYSNGTNVFGAGYVSYNSTTSVVPRVGYITTFTGTVPTKTDGAISNTFPVTGATGFKIFVSVKVPILGWSSSVQMSDSASQTGIAFRGTLSQSITGAAAAASLTLTSTYDTVGAYSGSTYTVQSPGKYRISGVYTSPSLAWSSTNVMYLAYSINGGSNVIFARQAMPAFTAAIYASGTDAVDLKSRDTIVFKGYSDVTGTFTGQMSIEKQASPVSIAATDTVAARYTTTAGQSISNASTAIINFDTKDYDTTGSVTTGASWKFTAPIQGKYLVKAFVQYASASFGTGAGTSLDLYKNGIIFSRLGNQTGTATASWSPSPGGADTVTLNADDFIDVRTAHSESTARSLQTVAGLVHVSIERINGAGG